METWGLAVVIFAPRRFCLLLVVVEFLLFEVKKSCIPKSKHIFWGFPFASIGLGCLMMFRDDWPSMFLAEGDDDPKCMKFGGDCWMRGVGRRFLGVCRTMLSPSKTRC